VIEEAKDHGLVLSEEGKLYDTRRGQSLPHGSNPMPLLSDAQLKAFPEPTPADVIPHYIARYQDLMALAHGTPAKVIGPDAALRDRPGFEVELIRRGSLPETERTAPDHEVLMVMRGHWRFGWEEHALILAPGDTLAVPPGLAHTLAPSMSGEASLYLVRATGDPAGATLEGPAAP
jgi:mannose-6-phosphate isomerase-like protein (cupin superfamily)